MWADQDKSEEILCTPKYFIQVTFSMEAEGEPGESWKQRWTFPTD